MPYKTTKELIAKDQSSNNICYCKKIGKFSGEIKFSEEKTERDKILILFRIFYLHFYTNFSYENNFRFEDFYSQELINHFTKFKILINDVKQFKIFSYSFYEQIIKEINKIDYNRIKLLYQY